MPAKSIFALQLQHTRPIIKRLHRQMQIIVGFQFDDRQSSCPRHSQQIEDGPVSISKGWNLRIKNLRPQRRFNLR